MFTNSNIVKKLKAEFPKGTRVQLDKMNDPFTAIPAGTLGTVTTVDDMGTVHVKWDTGNALGLVYEEDEYHKI